MVIRGTSPSNEQVLTFAWEGPVAWSDVVDGGRLRDDTRDYGLYQVYGAHPIYGGDVLLHRQGRGADLRYALVAGELDLKPRYPTSHRLRRSSPR